MSFTSVFFQTEIEALLFLHSWVPRLLISVLVGAALGIAGALFQHGLKNPLAAPSTLGLSAGAKLALTLATLYAPWMLGLGSEIVALAGAFAVGAVIYLMGLRSAFSPLLIILTGMVMALCCGAVAVTLAILNQEYLVGLFIWGNGSLLQHSWHNVGPMAIKVAIAGTVAVMIARPLELLSLNDEQSSAFGVSPSQLRLLCLGLAGWLTAVTVATVGVIAFVGLAAPTIARAAGMRRLKGRLVLSAVSGAGLLCVTDQVVQLVEPLLGTMLPTGAATGLFGAPLLIFLVRKLKRGGDLAAPALVATAMVRGRKTGQAIVWLCLIALLVATLFVSQGPSGWHFDWKSLWDLYWPWRGPRVIGAAAAGALLAMAGTILQRMTANPMASPETLGISAGAGLGMMAVVFAVSAPSTGLQIAGAGGGAAVILILILGLARRSGFAPEHILIAGVALTAMFDAIIGGAMALGDPRAARLLSWSAGSTYGVEMDQALIIAGLAIAMICVLPVMSRWLAILPLGEINARSIGVDLPVARGVLLIMAALMSGAATLLVGPLSFAGLIAPHLARLIGVRHALPHCLTAALIGAVLMMVTDWVGRTLFFPWQVPAGLVAAVLMAPILMWLLLRNSRVAP